MSHWESSGQTDEWYTPPYVFEALGCHFDLDVAHPRTVTAITPCDGYYCDNSLSQPWFGFIWMNPPYGGRNSLGPWLDKFFAHGNGIALVPDRTSAPWFQAAFRSADAVMFTPKIKFLRPDGTKGSSPSNGSALMASGLMAIRALERAHLAGLGILAVPAQKVATSQQELFA